MAKFELELKAEKRDGKGKGASRRLRREGQVLGIVYGGESNPQPITLNQFQVNKALENDGVYSHILSLTVSGTKQRVVLKDVQRHPILPRIMHMDFMRISENKPITMHVPIHFLGQDVAPGVVLEGGTVTHHMVELEIKCLPKDLPESFEIDLSDAPLNTVVHLSQIKMPKGVELTSVIHGPEDDLPVVSIHKPKRVEVEETPAEGAEATPEEAKKAEKSEKSDKK